MNIRASTTNGPRTVLAIAAIAALLLSLAFAIRPNSAAAFTAGDNGHPTSGPYSDLKGGTASFTFEANATLTCSSDTASGFAFTVDYNVTGTLPTGATLVVYLSPNQGAINGNAGGDTAGYIATVESNYTVLDVGGLTGTDSMAVHLTVTDPFQLSSGGVLGVFASEQDGQVWTSKTNSLNCTEASPTPTPTPTPVVTPTPTPTQTPEGSVEAATPTPSASVPNTAIGGGPSGPSSPTGTLLFALILILGISTLTVVNVKAVRNR